MTSSIGLRDSQSNRNPRYYFACCFSAIFLIFCSNDLAAKIDVYYAGIAYMGNYAAQETLYKYSSRLLNENEQKMQAALRNRLTHLKNDNIKLIIGAQPVDYKKGNALTLAFAIEYENVSLEHIGDFYKTDIDLRANILIFDYSNLIIVSSYPIAVQLRDLNDHKPTESELQAVVASLYFGNSGLNIFDEFAKRLSEIEVKRAYKNTLKVRTIRILDDAIPHIPNIGDKYVKNNYEVYLAQMFSSYLSKNQNVSVLPYTKGHAIGNKMALQIANGDVYNLTIPDETYAIDIDLRKMVKKNLGSNDYKSVWGYASFFNIKLFIPGEDVVLTDGKFRGLVTKTILKKSSHTVDDWSVFKESMNQLFEDFTVNIAKRDGEWLKGVTKTRNIVDQLKKFDSVVKSCR